MKPSVQALVLKRRKKTLQSGGTWRNTSARAIRIRSFRSSILLALSNLPLNAAIVVAVVKRGSRQETSVYDCRNSETKSRFHSREGALLYQRAGADQKVCPAEGSVKAWKADVL